MRLLLTLSTPFLLAACLMEPESKPEPRAPRVTTGPDTTWVCCPDPKPPSPITLTIRK